jgi:hypothetical protein
MFYCMDSIDNEIPVLLRYPVHDHIHLTLLSKAHGLLPGVSDIQHVHMFNNMNTGSTRRFAKICFDTSVCMLTTRARVCLVTYGRILSKFEHTTDHYELHVLRTLNVVAPRART